jgi:hypothetical protein
MKIMSNPAVNKSGSSIDVRDLNTDTVIGQLLNNEVFIYTGGHGSLTAVYFKTSSGTMANGILISPPSNAVVNIANYPYGTITNADGNSRYTLKARSSVTIYKGDESVWGTLASGAQVALAWSGSMSGIFMGTNNLTWIAVSYVQQMPAGTWVKVDGAGYNYGYIPMGFEYGSSGSTLTLYGTF